MERVIMEFALGDRLRLGDGKEIGKRKIRLRIGKWRRKKRI